MKSEGVSEDLKGVVIRDAAGNVIDPSKIELDQDFIDSLMNPSAEPVTDVVRDADPSLDSIEAAPAAKPVVARK